MTLDNLESTIFVGDKTFKGALQIDNSPGSEKVTNGAFTGNATGWTLGAQWAYGTNAVAKSGAGTSTLSQDVSAIADEIYKVVYTTSGISGGSITVSIGGVSGTARTTNATFTEYITATGTGNLTFTPASATAVTVDDVSVKRVGVAAADRLTAWVDDRGATAGKGALHVRTEDGTSHVFGDLMGIGTLYPTNPVHFYSNSTSMDVRFETDAAGGIASLSLDASLTSGTSGSSIDLLNAGVTVGRIGVSRAGADDAADLYISTKATGGSLTERLRVLDTGELLINASAAYADNGQLLEVNKSADDGGIGLFCWSATDAERPLLEFHKSASATIGTKALVADEEAAGGIIWKVADGAVNWSPIASVEGFVDTAPGAGDTGGRLVLSTTADGASSVTERVRIDSAGKIYINDSSNTNMTLGLVINQGAADDEILALKSSDVAHPMTGIAETDTYGTFEKVEALSGGLRIHGLKDADGTAAYAVQVIADLGEVALTTKSTAGFGIVSINARVTDGGTSIVAPAADSNLLSVESNGTVRFILDADGDSHQDVGTAWTNFDIYDDLAMLNLLSAHVTRRDDPLRQSFASWLAESREPLEAARIVNFNEDGHHFVNMSRLQMLSVGAIRQLGNQISDLTNRLQIAESRLAALPAAH